MLDRDRLDDLGNAEVFEVMRAGRALARRIAVDELVAAAHVAVLYDARRWPRFRTCCRWSPSG
ncbi:MAG: hypothetical protein Q8Q02_06550 [Nocardioides sp.]|nr:hypothetical protein [Nocardioides sp.]